MAVRGPKALEQRGERVAGRYRVGKRLGQGGMAAVFRVVDESSGRELALKRVCAGASAKERALFEREYYTLAGLRHPHVVEVHDYGADEHGPYYTMELLTGGDLAQLAPMDWQTVCALLRDVASALALLHARRLLHRDLSPRNVFRLPDGRAKLIDFGALAAFGTQREIVGTPPFIAPEALFGQALDQRADLFALGALGYWLLTGRQAFPARELHDLPELWRHDPLPPSATVRALDRSDLEPIPAPLDALIEALLSKNPVGRPRSAGEVIDRLVSVARLEPERNHGVVEGYLGSATFVGRERERKHVSELLTQVLDGRPGSVAFEAEPGQGRSRMLGELALEARVKGFTVLYGAADSSGGNHAAVHALALRALDTMPKLARSTATQLAPILGHLSPVLAARLGVNASGLAAMPEAPGEARMRIQAALRDWFLAMASEQPLAILVDDAHLIDEASVAWLAALAHAATRERLLLVATLRANGTSDGAAALEALRQRALRVQLPDLERAETELLVRSVFGDTAFVERTAELLQRIAEGNPAHVMELIEFLVRSKLAHYRDGSWMLPSNLEAEQLPATRDEALAARLRRLSPPARALGQVLSVHEHSVPLELCAALSGLAANELFRLMEELVQNDVLSGSREGYRFAHEGLRRTLLAELDSKRAKRAHRTLGEHMLSSANRGRTLHTIDQLEAGVHLFLSDAVEEGSRAIASAGLRLGLTELTEIGPAAPWLGKALDLFRAAGRSRWEQVALLAPLALAGYYNDRRYADRYGEEAVTELAALLRLPLARRLRSWLGKRLALFVALLLAAMSFRARRDNPRVPSFREAFVLLFNCVATQTGVATITINPGRARRFAEVLEPLTALGKDHVATLMHEFCMNLTATVQDRIDHAYRRWDALLARLETRDSIAGLPDNLRVFYLAGALYARGVIETWRDDSQALAFAERLDALQLRLYEMSAEQIRMMYYGNQGNMALFEHFRLRVEMHAIQRGTAWQAETWAPGAAITVYLRTHDVAGMRQSDELLSAFMREVPSITAYAQRARGALLLLRGAYTDALVELESVLAEEPQAIVGWGRSMGALARACNELGAHGRARELCERTLATLSDGDLAFPAMNASVQIELALAHAGLGNVAQAEAQLDALLARHAPFHGPLTMGALHEARAKVALIASDSAAVEEHLAQMERWYGATDAPSLLERGKRQRRLARTKPAGEPTGEPRGETHDVASRIRSSATLDSALQTLLAHLGSEEGALYARQSSGTERVARVGEQLATLEPWVGARLAEALPIEQDEHLEGVTVQNDCEAEIGNKRYRLVVLNSDDATTHEPVGGVLLPAHVAFQVGAPLQRALAIRLRAAHEAPPFTSEQAGTLHRNPDTFVSALTRTRMARRPVRGSTLL